MLVDKSVRAYSVLASGLVEIARLDFQGNPALIAVDDARLSVLVTDWNASDDTDGVKMSAAAGAGNATWSPFSTLARTQPAKISIWSLCLMGANSIAIFDEKTRSLMLYEFQ